MNIEELTLILKTVEGVSNGALYLAIAYISLSYLKVATVCGAVLYGVLKVASYVMQCELAAAEVKLEQAKTEWRNLNQLNTRVSKLEREK